MNEYIAVPLFVNNVRLDSIGLADDPLIDKYTMFAVQFTITTLPVADVDVPGIALICG